MVLWLTVSLVALVAFFWIKPPLPVRSMWLRYEEDKRAWLKWAVILSVAYICAVLSQLVLRLI